MVSAASGEINSSPVPMFLMVYTIPGALRATGSEAVRLLSNGVFISTTLSVPPSV